MTSFKQTCGNNLMNTLKKTVLTTLVATTFASGAFATDNEQSNKVTKLMHQT